MRPELDPQRLAVIRNPFRHSVVGGPDTVAKGVADFIARYRPDEMIVTAQIFDHGGPARSFEILSCGRWPSRRALGVWAGAGRNSWRLRCRGGGGAAGLHVRERRRRCHRDHSYRYRCIAA